MVGGGEGEGDADSRGEIKQLQGQRDKEGEGSTWGRGSYCVTASLGALALLTFFFRSLTQSLTPLYR
jgi:hypothetical protein